jgi:epoxyqueuosine reductase QueG
MGLEDHPTVKWYREKKHDQLSHGTAEVDAQWLKNLVLEVGADDVGIVEVGRPDLDGHRGDILRIFPATKSLISLVCRLNPENIRSLSRAASDLDFKRAMDEVDQVGFKAVRGLRRQGVRSLAPSSGFPMDLDLWPGKMWPVSHKPVAEAAGMGLMGKHRLLIHPRFGSFITLGTILIDRPVSQYDKPLAFNPCIKCGMCSAVCPVGAVENDGAFHFVNCITHNYRDRLGGFSDWVEKIVGSKTVLNYRQKVSDPETVSMWQGLTYGVSNKCSYCMAVCPAGEEMIAPYLDDRKAYMASVVKPLQEREDTVYVLGASDGEDHARKHFSRKKVKRVGNGIRPKSAANFLEALPLLFQRKQSGDLNATYHFTFTGDEDIRSTVVIKNKTLEVTPGHAGTPDLHLTADSKTWVGFLSKEKSLIGALLQRKIRLKGSPRLMKEFARCFPS